MNKTFITIVSGLPRSGTSMMMQVIEAAGIPPLTDNIRKKDVDNPKGYYEFEPVKRTKQDPSWVARCPGKVVKMVYSLLYDLPAGYEYRVIFMERKIEEVLASQKVMLERLGNPGAGVSDEKMADLFRRELERFFSWVKDQQNMQMMKVHYSDMIEQPEREADRINEFLGGGLDAAAMVQSVDPSLYRKRAQE